MSKYQIAISAARRFVRLSSSAMLATASAEMDGWPFGSITSFVTDHAGNPVMLLSDLAQHVKNLRRDPRASVLVCDHREKDLQRSARVTLMGRVTVIEGGDAQRARYLRYLPEAESYLGIHDFRFYRLSVERVRFIGGFGDIHWLRGEDFRLADDASLLSESEAGAVAHLNGDHEAAVLGYFKAAGISGVQARVLGIDPEGFDADIEGARHRLLFPQPITTPDALRAEFVRRSQELRERGQL